MNDSQINPEDRSALRKWLEDNMAMKKAGKMTKYGQSVLPEKNGKHKLIE